MLCSKCKKNTAVIFINDLNKEGKESIKGLCYNCAKSEGINPLDVLSKQNDILGKDVINLNDMTEQLEGIFKDISKNINFDALSDIDIENLEDIDEIDTEGMPFAKAIPLGHIFAGFSTPNNEEKENTNNSKSSKDKPKVKVKEKKKNQKRKFLETYGTNLTNKAKNDQLDLVIGRDKEIGRITQILNRRSKNNPCLIGEPGVGKTAIAQGLAIKIATGKVPPKLLNKEVYLLDMTSIIAGTQFRGQFESRMKSIIDECKNSGNIILVIDEIHNIIGAGDGEHAMNAANILKPSLSNGEIQLIGTTTLKEYRKYIEKDSALERRFQPVIVEEPNIDDATKILEGIKKYYESYHSVKISNDVIAQAVIMSEKYIHDRFLPDKAIDILDEACSRINLNNKDLYKLAILNNELKSVQEEKEEAAQNDSTEDYEKAAMLKAKECSLREDIDKLKAKMELKELTTQDIAQVIESWTKIPVTKITEVEAVSRAIRRNRAGLKSTKRPPSFIFVGPTGVGKTQLAKTLAYEMFGSKDSIIRIDMSEYMESHSTSKLIGSPPGYVGYDDAGQLTEKVKRHPYSIILLDEIEDSQGNTVSLENTIIIMTSNSGSNMNTNALGFGNSSSINKEKIKSSLSETFRPEFLNRIDEIIVFDSLSKSELLQIVDLMLEDTSKILENKDIKLNVSTKAKEFIIEKGTDLKFGARPLRRAIQRYVEDEISDMILKQEILNGQTIKVDLKNNELKFNV